MLEPSWRWDLWIPRGTMSMICGPENSGNALVATWMACELLRSRERLSSGGERIDPNRRIMWLDERAGYARLLGRLRVFKTDGLGIFWPVEEPKTTPTLT